MKANILYLTSLILINLTFMELYGTTVDTVEKEYRQNMPRPKPIEPVPEKPILIS